MPLLSVLARMEIAGVLIDRDALRAMSDEFAAQLAGLETRIFESVGHEFNIGSPRQLETVLFDELEPPSTKRTKTARSTDASVLEELRDRHEVVGMILEHRQVAKLKSTYADALPGLVDADGRLDLLPGGGRHRAAVEHRSESPEHPDPDGAGPSDPAGVRGPSGKLLLAADYSQVELRILAHVSGDAGLKAAFAAGEDIHRSTAARCSASPRGRDRRAALDREDGELWRRLRDERLRPRRSAPHRSGDRAPVHHRLLRRVRGDPPLHDRDPDSRARDQGYVTTLLGRRRYLPELTARNALRAAGERMAINMPIQGTAADGIKIAMVRLDAAMRERGLHSRMLLQVHDELVFETDADERDELAALAAETMEGALPLDVPLTVDLKVGTDWDQMDRLAPAEGGGYRVIEVDHAEEATEEAVVAPVEADRDA